jgi:ribose-phosphate pyrophosphokinase
MASEQIKLLYGNAHPELAKMISRLLNVEPGSCEIGKFANGETSVVIWDSVRGNDVYIIQPICISSDNTLNDNLMELLILVDTVKLASAGKINAVIPYFAYATHDKKDKARVPITCKLVANMLEKAGIDRVITMDLHAGQVQGFFDVPLDNLYAEPLFAKYTRKKLQNNKGVIIALKPAQAKRAAILAEDVECDIAFLNKINRKAAADDEESFSIVGDVKDKIAVIVQDIADSCVALEIASHTLVHQGARAVYAVISHAVLSEGAVERIMRSAITEVAVTNTIPLSPEAKSCPKIKVMNIAPTLAEVIRRTHHGESVTASDMFTIL